GRTSISSASTVRLSMSGSGVNAEAILLLAEAFQLPELALHLAVDVERLLSLANAPLVAADDELAHLLDQLRVGAQVGDRPLSEELRELRLDLKRRLPPNPLPVCLGLEELADLGLADLRGGGGGV